MDDAEPAAILFDHATEGYFPMDLPHSYFAWRLEPDSHHLIEAVQHQR